MDMLLLLAGLALAQKPMTYQYFYDDVNQLTKVIDSDGNLVEYVYDEVGNMVEVKKGSVSGGLAVHHFTPQAGAVAAKVSLLGQGFSAVAGQNEVRFNGVLAKILSASATTLVTEVPFSATTGPISVTVAGVTASSDQAFKVLQAPVITSLARGFVVWAPGISGFRVDGYNLEGSTFTFLPAFTPPKVAATTAQIAPDGRSAVLGLSVLLGAFGPFVILATGQNGSSDAMPSLANTLTILATGTADEDSDELSNGLEIQLGTNPLVKDSDGDGFNDGLEVAFGTDPLKRENFPDIRPYPPRVQSRLSSQLNVMNPQTLDPPNRSFNIQSGRWSLLNRAAPRDTGRKTFQTASGHFALMNRISPVFGASPSAKEAFSNTISVLNGAAPPSGLARPGDPDLDADGLSDLSETLWGTDPFDSDSDGDGLGDGTEVARGTNPLDANSRSDLDRPPRQEQTMGRTLSVQNQ